MRNQRKKTGKDDFKPPFNAVAWENSVVGIAASLWKFGLATKQLECNLTRKNTATALQHYTKYVKYAEDLET